MLDPQGMNEVVDSTPFMGTEVAVLREYSICFAYWLFMCNILIVVLAQFIHPNDTVPTCFCLCRNTGSLDTK